jgi:Outer membrane protein beta-barrel domain
MTTRSILALLAVPLAATTVPAQPRELASRPRVGIVGGANVARMTERRNPHPLTGAYVGGQVVLPRNDYLSLQLEVAWSQKGVRATGTIIESGEPFDYTLRNSYVEMPVLLRLDSPLAIGVRPVGAIPFVVAGPSLGVSVRCDIDGASATQPVSYDCDDAFGVKTFDFGAMLGAGLEAPIGALALSLGARYTIGMPDVFEGTRGKNRTLVVVAGVNF